MYPMYPMYPWIQCIHLYNVHQTASWTKCLAIKKQWRELNSTPPPHSHRIKGYMCSFPITWTPYTRGKIGNCKKKNTPFPGFLVKSSKDYSPKIPSFPRWWEHACGPFMHSSDRGVGVDKSTVSTQMHNTSRNTLCFVFFSATELVAYQKFSFSYYTMHDISCVLKKTY